MPVIYCLIGEHKFSNANLSELPYLLNADYIGISLIEETMTSKDVFM